MVARNGASGVPPLTVGDVRGLLGAAQHDRRKASPESFDEKGDLRRGEAGFREMRRRLLEFRRAFGSLGEVTESPHLSGALRRLAAETESAGESSSSMAAGGYVVVEKEKGP